MASTFGIQFEVYGRAWDTFLARIQANVVGAEEMARTHFLVGSRLPYASRWIEQGVRRDPRLGFIEVQYRTPRNTRFMAASAQAAGAILAKQRPGGATVLVGAVLSGDLMARFAQDIADNMRTILNAEVYSNDNIPVTMRGIPKWQRSHRLFNSIKVYKV